MTTTIVPEYIQNDWVQLSVTMSLTDQTVRVYQNETLVNEYVDNSLFQSLENNLAITIGKSRDDDLYFKGLIDNFSVYTSTLTNNEIETLYYDTNNSMLDLNTWSHVSALYSSFNNEVSTYLNGQLVYKKSYTPSHIENANNIDIGKGFSGEISEVILAERPFFNSEILYLSSDISRFDKLFPLLNLNITESNTTQISDVSGLNNQVSFIGGTPTYVLGYIRGTHALSVAADQNIQIANANITNYDFNNNTLFNICVSVSSFTSDVELIKTNEFTLSMSSSAINLIVGANTTSLTIGTIEENKFIDLIVQISKMQTTLTVIRKDTGAKYVTNYTSTIPKITTALTCCGTNFVGNLQKLEIFMGHGIENELFEKTMYSVYKNDFATPVLFSDMTVVNMVNTDGVISGMATNNSLLMDLSLPMFLQVEITPSNTPSNTEGIIDIKLNSTMSTYFDIDRIILKDAIGEEVPYDVVVNMNLNRHSDSGSVGNTVWPSNPLHTYGPRVIFMSGSIGDTLFTLTPVRSVASIKFVWYKNYTDRRADMMVSSSDENIVITAENSVNDNMLAESDDNCVISLVGTSNTIQFGFSGTDIILVTEGTPVSYSSALVDSSSVDVPIALFMDDLYLIAYLNGEEITRVSRVMNPTIWNTTITQVGIYSNSTNGTFKNIKVTDKNVYATSSPHTVLSASLFDIIGTVVFKYDFDSASSGVTDKINIVSTQGGTTAPRHILTKNTYTLPLYVECVVKPGNVANAFGLHVFRLNTNTAVSMHTIGDNTGFVFGISNNQYYYTQSGSVYTNTSTSANTVNGVEYKLAIYISETDIFLYHNEQLITTININTDAVFWNNVPVDGGKIGFYSNDAGDTQMRSFVTLKYNPNAANRLIEMSDLIHYDNEQLYYNYNLSDFDRIAFNTTTKETDILGQMHVISKQKYTLPIFLECELKTTNSFVGLHLFTIDKSQSTETPIDTEMNGIIWGKGKNTNELYYKICNDVMTSSTVDDKLQYFSKFAIYVDENKIRLYQDGMLMKSVQKSDNALFWNNLDYDKMGYFGIYGETADCKFRNLTMSSRDIYYQPDVSNIHIESYINVVEQTICIADYDFNQSSGTIINSLSNGTNGQLNQGPGTYPVRETPSYFENGMSIKFVRSGWIDIPVAESWSNLSDLSLSVWIKPTLDGNEHTLLDANIYKIGITSAGNLSFNLGANGTTITKVITVQTVDVSNVYFIDGVQQDIINIQEGNTYVFDWSSISGHPVRLSTTSNGTHSGGIEYTQGVIVDAVHYTTTIIADANTPRQLYYYCEYHGGMGGAINVTNIESIICTNYTLTSDDWVHVAITIDSFNKDVSFYVNNILQSSHTIVNDMSNQLTVGSDVLQIGSNYGGSIDTFKLFKGIISRLVIYDESVVPTQTMLNKIPTSEYTHVAAVYESDKNMISTYVNGEYNVCYEKYLQDYRTIGTNNSNINIGYNDNGKYFDGYLDDIRIYNKSLNNTQIKAIYDSYYKQIWFTNINYNYSNKVYSVVGREPSNTPANFSVVSFIIASIEGVFETEEQLIDLYSNIGTTTITDIHPYRKILYTTTGNTKENITDYIFYPTISFSYYYNSVTTTASINDLDNVTNLKFHIITKSYDDTYLFYNQVIER
tara:strand:+ start:33182 stop:38068 length:4887 start_codon:yes stop_codon:yes gene_type:complete